MRKSLYKKFYITFLAVTLAGFFLLGSIVLAFSGNYQLGESKRLLASQAKTVSDQIAGASYVYAGAQLNHYAYQIATVVANAANSQMMVVDLAGYPVACVGSHVREVTVPAQYVSPYLSHSGTFTGDMGGVLTDNCVIAAAPVTIGGGAGGVVYAIMPTGRAGAYMQDLLQLLLIAALVTALLMGVAAYLFASAMVRPLSQMSRAAKCLAAGDFSQRIRVTRQDEIGQLTRAFNDMTLSLEAGEKMRKGFVANVSHELRTPMTTIAGFVDGILDGTIPPHRQKEYLATVSGEIKRLSRLVNMMLSLSRLESGEVRLNKTETDLTGQVLSAAFMLEKEITEKQLEITGLQELERLPVDADNDLIHQVVYNLLENAVKYTPEMGWIRVQGWREAGRVHLSIRNSGEGIAEEDLPFVFDRFYKTDSSRGTDKNSLGLGLYLVKTIIALHSGTITVRSVQDSFCEFETVLEEYQSKEKENS